MIGSGLMRRFGLLMLLPFSALAGQGELGDALMWLSKMARAAHEQNYDGEFVYDDGERMDALRIIHQGGPQERERIVSLNGSGREVIREGSQVTCVFPEVRQVYVDDQVPSFAFDFPPGEDLARLQQYYELRVVGRDRVADRATVQVEVTPRDAYRYGYRLWLDEATGLLLKSELVDHQGRVVERLMFTRLTLLEEVPEALLEPQIDTTGFQILEDRAPVARPASLTADAGGAKQWQVGWVPAGFQLTESRRKGPAGAIVQLVYGDGFSLVSVFIEPAAPGEPEGEGVLLDKGAVHGYTLVRDGHRITAVGELPPEAVARIARSVNRQAVAHSDPLPAAALAR